MRTELKKLRKDIMPTPVSRMKKCDIANQIERLKPMPEVKKIEAAEEVVKKTKAAKKEPAVKKIEAAEVVVKKAKAAKKEPAVKKIEVVKKAVAGSVEMRTKMAAIRAKRTAKKCE